MACLRRFAWSVVLLAILGFRVFPAPLGTVPEGTRLEIRLTTGVSTASAHVGDPIAALLTVDAPAPGGAVAAGAVIRGTIREVTPFSWSTPQAALTLDFQELVPSSGAAIPIATRVTSVDNAREGIGPHGRILGITPPHEGPSSAEESVLWAAIAPELVDVSRLAFDVRKLERPDITYGPGTDLELELTAAAVGVPLRPTRIDAVPAGDLQSIAASQPIRTMAGSPPRPADVINLAFSAADDVLEAGFVASGWTTAVALGLRADYRTILAVAEDRGYRLGPVSLQTFAGRPPDRVFQKQTNTFDRRHHVRIWRLPQMVEGRPVWAASATHDVGIKFTRSERTFTHRVETDIDLERQKIVDDLRFAGFVESFALAIRPTVPTRMVNATDDEMTTDGRIAVIVLGRP